MGGVFGEPWQAGNLGVAAADATRPGRPQLARLGDCSACWRRPLSMPPRRVPQLADAAEVLARIRKRPGVRYPVLAPNMKVCKWVQGTQRKPHLLAWACPCM